MGQPEEDILSQFQVIRYQPKLSDDWNDFIGTAKNATFLFHRNFMDYHSHRFEDFSLCIYRKGSLFAVVPAHQEGHELYSHLGLTYGGMVLQEQAKLFDVWEAVQAMLHFLHNHGITHWSVKLPPTFYHSLPSDELEYILYRAGAELTKKDVLMVIDYQHQLPFQKNRREGLNKAKRNELTVRVDQNFEGFWNEVLIPNLKRKHEVTPVHSLDEIRLLAHRFPNNIKQVSVYKGDELVAGTTVFLTKTTVHPQYVSGKASKNAYGSLDLAYDFCINHWKEGRRYFDFNISSENDGKALNTGLIFWKETCGARSFTADNYRIATNKYDQLKPVTT
ncbi:GNAT family N-acetyltransferase [Altibacter sp. HG106]|uniref:GNAT family N-acetyltransferase n=1 Tax=Altibacter sp. HG106 TaxID=3023937 RepID=UPI002350AA5B|nr:GNAT family N-acetyltransferase [Altibacter sp. HG106]MDC7996136.1 GNAT family N-acetyltransferase [Altibacter sp. HG106]